MLAAASSAIKAGYFALEKLVRWAGFQLVGCNCRQAARRFCGLLRRSACMLAQQLAGALRAAGS